MLKHVLEFDITQFTGLCHLFLYFLRLEAHLAIEKMKAIIEFSYNVITLLKVNYV